MKQTKRQARRAVIWRTFAILSGLAALLAIGFAIYRDYQLRNPAPTVGTITGTPLVPSTASKNELIKFMNKEELIIAVGAVSISLTKNQLRVEFFESELPEIQQLWENYKAKGIPTTPAFSTIPETNIQLAQIINGDFGCYVYKSTEYALVEKNAPWICSMTVPPGLHSSGDLIGFISFHLTREPTNEEKIRLGEEVAAISQSIYTRDINGQR